MAVRRSTPLRSPMHPKKISRPVAAFASVLLSFFFPGCATTYEFKVDAISQPGAATGQTFSLTTRQTDAAADKETSLRDKEAAEFVRAALVAKGLREAAAPGADVTIALDYGSERPRRRTERASAPVYAQTYGGVRYAQVAVRTDDGRTGVRTIAIAEPPRTELIGFQDHVAHVTVREKFLRLSARDTKSATEVWSVHVSIEDESSDLRKYLPLLAGVAADYIGKDTRTQQTVEITEKEKK